MEAESVQTGSSAARIQCQSTLILQSHSNPGCIFRSTSMTPGCHLRSTRTTIVANKIYYFCFSHLNQSKLDTYISLLDLEQNTFSYRRNAAM